MEKPDLISKDPTSVSVESLNEMELLEIDDRPEEVREIARQLGYELRTKECEQLVTILGEGYYDDPKALEKELIALGLTKANV